MEIQATREDAGRRIDAWLEPRLEGLSRSRIQALIKDGAITVDGRRVKPHHKVQAGETAAIAIPAPRRSTLAPEAIPLAILFEDDTLIAVNKPPGLVVHPAAGHAGGTLVNALLHHCRDLTGIGGEQRPGIVHRLDKDTSGVIVVAKTQAAVDDLVRQFKQRTVRKTYWAIVHGRPPADGTIDTPIGRSASDRKKMSARPPRGRAALTRYTRQEVFDAAALLAVHPETGRTHQIRVHLAHAGFPIVGDRAYGRRGNDPMAPRQMLHAASLRLHHPRTGGELLLEAPLPPDMAALLARLRTAPMANSCRRPGPCRLMTNDEIPKRE